jgi:hypothetical protein
MYRVEYEEKDESMNQTMILTVGIPRRVLTRAIITAGMWLFSEYN